MSTAFNEDYLVREERYPETMRAAVLPFLREKAQVHTVKGYQEKPLYAVRYAVDQPAGTAVIVHGFTESADKYSELIYSLLNSRMNVVAYDQRGHGRSWRDERITDPSLTHVTDFNEYVGDLEAVVDQLLGDQPKPWVLFAHSMGGAVAALYLERHPGVFARAALCAPMIAPNLNGVPRFAGECLCRGAKALGKAASRIPFSRPYSGPEDFATSAATGRARFDWYDALKAEHPEFRNNGPTYQWTLESMHVTDRILAPGEAEKILCPVRIYTAEHDGSVMPQAQEQLARRLKNGKRTLVKGARHEIYRSGDEVLFPWWHEVLTFLTQG